MDGVKKDAARMDSIVLPLAILILAMVVHRSVPRAPMSERSLATYLTPRSSRSACVSACP